MASTSPFHRLLAEARGRLSKPPDSMKARLAKFKKVMGSSKKSVSMKAKLERFSFIMGQKGFQNSMKARLAKFNRVMSRRPDRKRKLEPTSDGPAAKIRHLGHPQSAGTSNAKVCNIKKTISCLKNVLNLVPFFNRN